MEFEHYLIRQTTQQDAAAFFALVESNRKRLEDFFAGTVSKTRTAEDTEIFIAEQLKKAEDKTYFPYLVIDTEHNKIAGFIDVKNIDWNIPKAELGCFVDASYAARGISYKSLSLVIAHLFQTYRFNKLFLRTHHANKAARALAEKCGFEVEGIIRKDYKTTRGELVDLVYYGLLNPA